MNQCLALFLQFCKFSVLCFGGGYMLIPLLTTEFVEPDDPARPPAAAVQTSRGSVEQAPSPAGNDVRLQSPSPGEDGSGKSVSDVQPVPGGNAGGPSAEAQTGSGKNEPVGPGSGKSVSGVQPVPGGNAGKVLTESEFGNLVSVAQVTPGPVGLNTATYVGYVEGGFFGALAASLGLIVPTILIGCSAAAGINRWKDTFLVRGMLKGTRLAAVALIMYAVTIFFGMSIFTRTIPWEAFGALFRFERPVLPAGFGISVPGILICGAVIVLMLKTKLPTTVLLLGSATAGAVFAIWFG